MPVAVNATRPDYNDHVCRWETVRSVVGSQVKKYIKDVDSTDAKRNHRYKEDAQFTNFTSRTKAGLVGAVFRKEPIIELPASIEYLNEDATGFNMPLSKLAQEITGEVLMTGRYGLLVDYPASEDNLSRADIEQQDLKALIYRYKAESIINWQVKLINGRPVLTLVVLKECVNELGDDGFSWKAKTQYRVLRLISGIYHQMVYDGETLELVSTFIPRQADGSSFNVLPFVFVGSEDNDSDIDISPLYDLAMLNIGHLRNSADYEESVHIVGQPTLIIGTEMTTEEFNAANPNGVLIGARRGHNLGSNGFAQFLQANPNQLADEAMKRKEEQAVMVGARLIVPQADRETAEAARMRHSGETSILWTISNNVESALIQCCKFTQDFMVSRSSADPDESVSIRLNKEFFDKTMDPNLIMAQIQLLNQGLIAKKDVRDVLRNYGIVDESRSEATLDSEATPLEDPNLTF